MHCLSIEDLYDFIEGRLNEDEMTKFDEHIQSCGACSLQLEELLEEENAMFSIFPSVSVDETFTNQVMNSLPGTNAVVSKKREWRAAIATVFVSAALLFLMFIGLQTRTMETVTSSSSVNINVKEVNITDASIEVTLATSGYDGNELFFNESISDNDNQVLLVLPNGERESIGFYADQLKNEITYEFSLFDVPYTEFELLFDFKRIYDLDGHWTFEVPINRKELLAKTENVTLRSSFEKDGVNVNFIRAQHGPYNTIIKFETKFTEDMATFVEQQVAQYTAELPVAEKEHFVGYNAQILYKVIDADGQTLNRSNLEDTISIQNDRYAHTETIGTYPRVQEGGYISVIGAKFELPTNVRYALTVDQLPYTFSYKDTLYEVKLLPNGQLEISSDANTATINQWGITVDNEIAWDTAKLRTDDQKQYITFTMEDNINLDSFILYGQTETNIVYFDEAIHVNLY
ncbi:hypothetical protein MTP04_23730 [Lysinibacillus sp. PLM2]|nr:hypothetical protein MTP04_23730 [Lysinibacillus sp. PLM2]